MFWKGWNWLMRYFSDRLPLTENPLFTVFDKFEQNFPGFRILDDRADRHVQINICATLSYPGVLATVYACLCPDMLCKFQMDERPQAGVGADNNISAPSAIATGTGGAKDSDMINKVSFHNYSAFLMLILGSILYWMVHV